MSNKKKNTEKFKLTEEQTEKLMLGAAFSSYACIINKKQIGTCPHSPFSKEYVKIMQTLQDKWQKILKPYVLLPYRWNTKPHMHISTYSFFHIRKTYCGNQA